MACLIPRLCSSRYRVESYQGFYLVYCSTMHYISNYEECDLSPKLEVDHLVHVFDPTLSDNRQICSYLETLVMNPNFSTKESIGIETYDRFMETVIIEKYDMHYGGNSSIEVPCRRTVSSQITESYDKGFIIENLTSFVKAKTSQIQTCRCLRCEKSHVRSFTATCLKTVLGNWPYRNHPVSPMINLGREYCISLWNNCLTSRESLDLLDRTILHLDPCTKIIARYISQYIHFLRGDGGKLSLVINAEAEMPFHRGTVLEYCLEQCLVAPLRALVHNYSYYMLTLAGRAWPTANSNLDKKTCSIILYFMLLSERMNIETLQCFGKKYLKVVEDTSTRVDDRVVSLQRKFMLFWLGKIYDSNELFSHYKMDTNVLNSVCICEVITLMFANDPVSARKNTMRMLMQDTICEYHKYPKQISCTDQFRKCLNLHQSPPLPTLRDFSRSSIRQHLCRGYSILPNITGFIQTNVLPIRLIEYLFLYEEILQVYPAIAHCVKTIFKRN